jgi:DNA-binding transcriptional regulator YdaS (Cro superfamily)
MQEPAPKAERRSPSRGDELLDAGVLARHHLEVARAALRSDREMARILGVDPAQVSRWRTGGQVPEAGNADRLAALSIVIEMLSRWLHPASIPSWLRGSNAHLGDRSPAFMIRHDHVADVIAALEADEAGAYA